MFVISKKGEATHPQTELAVATNWGKQAGRIILAFVLVLNRLPEGGALPGCEGVWENFPSG